jgi:hypothetical protein
MPKNKKTTAKKLLAAIAEDAISTAGVPVSTLKVIAGMVQNDWERPESYLKWDDFSIVTDFYNEENKLIKFPYDERQYKLAQVLEIDNSLGSISTENIFIESNYINFIPTKDVIEHTDEVYYHYDNYLHLHKTYHEGQLARLNFIKYSDKNIILNFSPVSYEIICRTNLCMDAKENKDSKSLREVLHDNDKLEPLQDSQLGNALGVNFILFTADGTLVIPLRSDVVVVRPNQLSPSSSGDINYSDVFGGDRKLESVHLFRESIEELNVYDEHIKNNHIQFLGLTRELVRGGKPDLYFAAGTNLTKREYIERHPKAQDSWEFKHHSEWVFWPFGTDIFLEEIPTKKKFAIQRKFERLLDKEGHRISLPLLTGLVLFLRIKLKDYF